MGSRPQLNSNMLSFAAISAIVAVSYAQSSSDEIILQCRANSIVDVSADADYADGAAAALERARVLVRGVNKEGEDFEEAFGKAETGVDISLNIVEQNEEQGAEAEDGVEQGVNGQFTATVARDSCEDLMNVDSANPWVNTENVAIWADTEVQNGEFENNIRESWVEGVILRPACRSCAARWSWLVTRAKTASSSRSSTNCLVLRQKPTPRLKPAAPSPSPCRPPLPPSLRSSKSRFFSV